MAAPSEPCPGHRIIGHSTQDLRPDEAGGRDKCPILGAPGTAGKRWPPIDAGCQRCRAESRERTQSVVDWVRHKRRLCIGAIA